MAEFLELHYPGDDHIKLRKHVTAFTEGFDIADINKASVHSLYREWSHEENIYRIPGGYEVLINHLYEECTRKHCQILTNQTVRQIDWENDHVTVHTSDRQKYYAQKIIITVPISVLCKTVGKPSINITPALHEHIKAANQIGMGHVVKVTISFHVPFWKDDTAFILSDEIFPTWWTQLPDTTPILTGWAGGPKAEELSHYSKQDIFEIALQSLGNIFEKPVEDIRSNIAEGFVFNWLQDEYASGAYTFSMPASPIAKKILNAPVENTVYFAGEGTYEGNAPGTVEAALSSGKEAARKIITSSQRSHSPILDGKEW
jgi:monoamine oxidase